MNAFDKLTLAELQEFKLANDRAIAEAYLLLGNLDTHERTLDSYIFKKQPFTWPWDRAKPLFTGRYMWKHIDAPCDSAKFCTVEVGRNGPLVVNFGKNPFDNSETVRFLHSVQHREWIKLPDETE
jgi:hypothetical protein